MVNTPSPTPQPTSPGFSRRFGASRNVIERIAGFNQQDIPGGPYRLSAGPGGEVFPPTPDRSSAYRNARKEGAVMSIQAILYDKGSNVVTIAPGASLKSAAEKLRDKNIAALIVQSGGAILGLISEREIVHALADSGDQTCGLPVSQVMSREIVTVAPQDSLKRAMALMTRHRTRHLLVLKDGQPAGIVSIGDVIKHRLEDLELRSNTRSGVYATAH